MYCDVRIRQLEVILKA